MKQIITFFLLFVAIHASPLQRRDASDVSSGVVTNRTEDVESTPTPTDYLTTDEDSTEQTSTSHSPIDRLVQEIVIHNYQDELFPIYNNATLTNSSDEDSFFSSPSPVDHQGQNIVLHAHKDEDIVQSVDGVTGGSVIHREIDAIFVKPVGEVVVAVPKVDVKRSVDDADATPNEDVKRSVVGDTDATPNEDVKRRVEDVDATPNEDVKRSVVDKDATPNEGVKRSVDDVDATPNEDVKRRVEDVDPTLNHDVTRRVDDVDATPNEDVIVAAVIAVSTDADMAVAESGMVFRPMFRYRQESRRRLDRNVRRRSHRRRLRYYY